MTNLSCATDNKNLYDLEFQNDVVFLQLSALKNSHRILYDFLRISFVYPVIS